MDEETKKALEEIDRVRERAPSYGPFVLTPEYLALIEELEARPENQSGADKSWVERAHLRELEYYRKIRSRNPDVRS